MVQVNVRDANYTSQVEAVLAGKDFYSFVTQTQEDKSFLLKEVKVHFSIHTFSSCAFMLSALDFCNP